MVPLRKIGCQVSDGTTHSKYDRLVPSVILRANSGIGQHKGRQIELPVNVYEQRSEDRQKGQMHMGSPSHTAQGFMHRGPTLRPRDSIVLVIKGQVFQAQAMCCKCSFWTARMQADKALS